MLALLLKLAGAPLLVAGASLAGRRFGPSIAGLLSGLPVIAGPIIAVLWLEQGAVYAAQVAQMLLVGLAPLAAYLWLFARLAQRRNWLFCLLGGWAVFLLLAFFCHKLSLPVWLLASAALLSLGAVGVMLPRPQAEPELVGLPRIELLARIVAAFVLVFGLTSAAARVGVQWTGMLAAFPVAGSVMPAFTLARSGQAATLRLLRGFVSGLFGLAAFALCLALCLPLLDGWAFPLALLAALLTAWFNSTLVFRS